MGRNGFLNPSDQLLVIIGPSGSGKSTAVRKLVGSGILEVTPSWTTRPKRSTEEDEEDVEHIFVEAAAFERKIDEDFFLETVSLFDLPFQYGLPAIPKPKTAVPAIMLRAPLLPLLLKHYKQPIVYHIEAPFEQVQKQLHKRDKETLGNRLEQYEAECKAGRRCAARIFTNDSTPEDLVNQLTSAVQKDFL